MTKFRTPTFFASRSSGAMPTRSSISLTFSFAMMEKTTARMVLVRQSTSRDHRLMAYSRNGLRIIVADLLLSLDWMEFRLCFCCCCWRWWCSTDDVDFYCCLATATVTNARHLRWPFLFIRKKGKPVFHFFFFFLSVHPGATEQHSFCLFVLLETSTFVMSKVCIFFVWFIVRWGGRNETKKWGEADFESSSLLLPLPLCQFIRRYTLIS